MCSLALAAVVYIIVFSKADLFKIAGCTAIAAISLVSWVLLKNRSSAQIVTKFEPWLYVSHAMQMLGLGKWLSGPLAFALVALPIYLVGGLGLRVYWRSRNPLCNIPPKTRGRSPVLARDFRGDRRGHRAHVQLYASRMDFSIQPN